MQTLKSLLTEEMIEDLATRSYFRYGKEIAKEGNVTILEQNTFNVTAKVQVGENQTRTVELMSTPKGFRFKCTCTNRKNIFCQHCVAVALSLVA